MVDETIDRGTDKQFVILARVENDREGKITTMFIDMPICNLGTAQDLCDVIDKSLR